MCLCRTVLRGEEWGLGAWGVLRPGGHQLHWSDVFISQLSQANLTSLDHLLHSDVFLKCFHYLILREREKKNREFD